MKSAHTKSAHRLSTRSFHAPPKKNRTFGYIAIFLNVFFWGLSPVIIKQGLNHVPPDVFLFYRFVIATLVALPIAFLLRKQFRSMKKPADYLLIAAISALSNPITLLVLFEGIQFTTSSSSAVIAATIPLFVTIGGSFFLKEKVGLPALAGILIATLGTTIIAFSTPAQEHALHPTYGNMLVVVHNILWTASILMMKKWATRFPAFVFSLFGWAVGAVFCAVTAAIRYPEWFFAPERVLFDPAVLQPIAYMAVFGSVIAFTAYQIAQEHLTASETSIFTYLEPAITLPFSVLLLREQLSVPMIGGLVLLAIGVAAAELHPKRRAFLLFEFLMKKRRL